MVVSTGGVSAGDTDWIRPLVAELGAVEFWKLFLRPGRPFAFGSIGEGVPFFGLPGNPVAAAVTALQLLWPALLVLEVQKEPELFPRVMVAADPLSRRPGRRNQLGLASTPTPQEPLARVECSLVPDRSLQQADLLLELPAVSGPLERGTRLWAQVIRQRIF